MITSVQVSDKALSEKSLPIKNLLILRDWLNTLSTDQLLADLAGIGTHGESDSDCTVTFKVASEDFYEDADGLIQEERFYVSENLEDFRLENVGKFVTNEKLVAGFLDDKTPVFKRGEVFVQFQNGQ